MNLLPIADYLEDGGFGSKSKSIFINQMPVNAKNAVLLRNPIEGTEIDHELPGYYKTYFEMTVRSADYQKGEQKALEISQYMNVSDALIGDMSVKYLRPCNLPVAYPLSDGDLIEFRVKFDIAFVV